MVEKLVSFWEGLLAGAMLVSGRVLIKMIKLSNKALRNQPIKTCVFLFAVSSCNHFHDNFFHKVLVSKLSHLQVILLEESFFVQQVGGQYRFCEVSWDTE